MADSGKLIVNPLALWGTILAGARQGIDTTAMQAAINTQLEATGTRYGPTTLPAVSKLWGQAKAMVVASRELARAPADYAITSRMIGVVPYGQTAAGRAGMPRYNVRINFTVAHGEVREPRSYVIEGIDPSTYTAGALRAEALEYAQDSAGGSPIDGQIAEFEGIDDIYIEQM